MTTAHWLLDVARSVGPWALVLAAVALVAESGLLIGVVLPGISVPVGLGLLAGTGTVPAVAAGATAVAAAAAGPSLGFRLARREGTAFLHDRRVPGIARRALETVEHRPALTVVVGQWFAVARTLAPRLAADTGLPYARFALVSVPAAAAWAFATFTLGRYLVIGSATAARILSAQQVTAGVLLALLVIVLVWTLVRALVRRRRT
ncbi:hypothetical protein [Pseudonocardia phyllosphaerae]|uniref:hypothetical protein n=1 Tax=Pseudonocardia phyllosphaerae TaxID=3390502 RepID=UPI00397A02FE